jgi:hypothetical protein
MTIANAVLAITAFSAMHKRGELLFGTVSLLHCQQPE